jgi:hypothetical protein
MSSLDLELDGMMDDLEFEWRAANAANLIAHAEYRALLADPQANANLLGGAWEWLSRIEARKARIFAKIESLEDSMLGLS